jgi:hypothetical protein
MGIAHPTLEWVVYEHCIRPTSLPVRPPALANVFRMPEAAEPAFEIADPAEEVTRVSPSDALDWAWETFSFAAPAASEVEEALRMPARRTAKVECRSRARDAARDIATGGEDGKTRWGRWGRRLELGGWSSGKREILPQCGPCMGSAKVGTTTSRKHHHLDIRISVEKQILKFMPSRWG